MSKSGPLRIVVYGKIVVASKLRRAGVGSGSASLSTARTQNVWARAETESPAARAVATASCSPAATTNTLSRAWIGPCQSSGSSQAISKCSTVPSRSWPSHASSIR
ncbi:MAG: hypothetical protein ACRDGR_06045 [bacterium]